MCLGRLSGQLRPGVFLQFFAQVLRFGVFFGDYHGAYGFDPFFVGKSYDGDRLAARE